MTVVQSLQTFLASHVAAAIAAVFGFFGALALLWATWSTIKLRKAIIKTGQIQTLDPNIMTGAAFLLGKLQQSQLNELNREHNLYLIGVALLAIGFVLQFLHELL
jgi:hypothetical protein